MVPGTTEKRGGRTRGTWPKGSGIPASGEGWGGEANGAGVTERFSTEHQPTSDALIAGHQNRQQRSEMLENRLYDIAMVGTPGEAQKVQVDAAYKLHTIWNGTPVAKNLNINTDGGKIETVQVYLPDNGRDPASE